MIAKPFRPAILWLLLVLFLGSAQFGPQQTAQQIVPTLRTLTPWLPPTRVQTVHAMLRKLSHLTEYAVLALLWVRALRAQPRFTLKSASWAALALCLACAIVDETHQARVPGRQGSVSDVALDSLGAVAMLIVVRSRRQATARLPAPTAATELNTVRVDERA
jgi:VanZ family protein